MGDDGVEVVETGRPVERLLHSTDPRDQLRLAQDRYRLGAGTSLEVADAQSAVQQAEGDYVNAVYFYHKAVAALEAAVGRPLR